MDYIEYHISGQGQMPDYVSDLLADTLSAYGFDSFLPADDGLFAYCPAPGPDEKEMSSVLSDFDFAKGLTFTSKFMADKNWNETWELESNTPQVFCDMCVVHTPAYKDVPKLKYDILIDPKLSFGSGHHQTTTLMIERILQTDFSGKSVCDMGCGTAVLAILAHKMGAADVCAVDIDKWAFENAKTNIALNSAENIDLRLGGSEQVDTDRFDYFFANINRNILLDGMADYSRGMKRGAVIYFSGFYEQDIPVVQSCAGKYGLTPLGGFKKNGQWVMIEMKKV